jgi:pimeloyl-ACP methyl ester carboxylesterase
VVLGLAALASLVVPGITGTSAAQDGSPYPVPWTFAAAIPAGAQDGPDVPPPGTTPDGKDCTATPVVTHPRPVILVHGLGGDENTNWQTMSPWLADHGYCVYALTYGNNPSAPNGFDKFGGLADMTASAGVLAGFVQSVRSWTGAAQVDIVGHSEGGTMPDWYLKFDGGATAVAHFVAISGVLHGTNFWGFGDLYALGQANGGSQQFSQSFSQYCQSCTEFLLSSPWMTALDSTDAAAGPGGAAPVCPTDGAAVAGVAYTSIATNNDELVRPPTSDFIDPSCNGVEGISVDNILLQDQCPTDQADHISVVADPVVAQDILNALDPAGAGPIRCAVVLPAIG